MKTILKTLIENPSSKKWNEFVKIRTFFKERDKFFDEAIDFIEEFYNQYDLFPDWKTFQSTLSASGENKLLAYLSRFMDDPTIEAKSSDVDFISYLKLAQSSFLELDAIKVVNEMQSKLSNLEGKNVKSIVDQLSTTLTDLHIVKNKADLEQGVNSLVYGEEAVDYIRENYETIKRRKNDSESIYYDVGIKGFESVKIKKGDFIVIGGFTSHGKSIWARYLIYRFLIEYGLNVYFTTFEMTHDVCLQYFHILHANNKEIFPGTPVIEPDKFKTGDLSDEEEDFLLNVAARDFSTNKEYGSLQIDQPSKSRYTMLDYQTRVRELENTLMPLDVVAIDYITLMYPLTSGKGKPDFNDYNQMIKEFKNTALTHTNRFGNSSPLVSISPAQISRHGYDDAMKQDGVYEISAIKQYTEFDTSGDVVLTTLLTSDMKAASQIRLQNVKNRDGELVIDPVDLHIGLSSGFTIESLSNRSNTDILETLRSITI